MKTYKSFYRIIYKLIFTNIKHILPDILYIEMKISSAQ